MAIVKFGKVATVGSSGLTVGKIYFETSTGLIKVAKSTTEVDVFGSQVKDATYSSNILTITKTDGSNVQLNFSDVASASGVMAVFDEIQTELESKASTADLDTKATKTVALKSVTGTASADASKVTITLTTTTESGTATKPTITLPVATESAQGTTTEAKIKQLAKAEAETVAGSVYKVKGTKATIAEVLAVEDAVIGDVYNVTAAFTLNSQKYPAGTNVVFVGPAEEGEPDPSAQAQWDALGGTVDLTPYATTSYVNSELANKVDVTTQINGNALSGNVTLDGSDIALTGYSKAAAEAAVSASDSINVAIGKLEKGIEAAKASGVTTFGGKTGVITIRGGQAATSPAVNLTMSNNELQATVVGVATAAQGTAASTALQSVSATGANKYVTASAAAKSGTTQAITITAVTGSVSAGDDKLAIASDVKSYVDGVMTWEEFN